MENILLDFPLILNCLGVQICTFGTAVSHIQDLIHWVVNWAAFLSHYQFFSSTILRSGKNLDLLPKEKACQILHSGIYLYWLDII